MPKRSAQYDGMNKNTSPTKCDHPKCSNAAAWEYRVGTLDGIETTVACQEHVAMVRKHHGMNILGVNRSRRIPVSQSHVVTMLYILIPNHDFFGKDSLHCRNNTPACGHRF